jgi:diguanylate cyclase
MVYQTPWITQLNKQLFSGVDENLTELNTHVADNTNAPVLNKLSGNASAICATNETFRRQLYAARSEINTLKAELERSNEEAQTDLLTGLYNRRVFEVIYNKFVDNKKNQNNITLIMIGVGKFKTFNDTHGHLVGDQILKYIVTLLKK